VWRLTKLPCLNSEGKGFRFPLPLLPPLRSCSLSRAGVPLCIRRVLSRLSGESTSSSFDRVVELSVALRRSVEAEATTGDWADRYESCFLSSPRGDSGLLVSAVEGRDRRAVARLIFSSASRMRSSRLAPADPIRGNRSSREGSSPKPFSHDPLMRFEERRSFCGDGAEGERVWAGGFRGDTDRGHPPAMPLPLPWDVAR
jgi:hypothetical protein